MDLLPGTVSIVEAFVLVSAVIVFVWYVYWLIRTGRF